MQHSKIEVKCNNCPQLQGDTWCEYHKRQVWKEDEMCAQGYLERINKGVQMCGEIYEEHGYSAQERLDKIMDQVYELEKLWEEKFKKDSVWQEVVDENEIPF